MHPYLQRYSTIKSDAFLSLPHKNRLFPQSNINRITRPFNSIPSSYLYLERCLGKDIITRVKSVATCAPFSLKKKAPENSTLFKKLLQKRHPFCRSAPDSEKRTLLCIFVFTPVNTYDLCDFPGPGVNP